MLVEFPRPISYFHVYIYCNEKDPSQIIKAQLIRDSLVSIFVDIKAYELEEEPSAPHPQKYIKVHVYTSKAFSKVVPWLTVNRNGLSCLIQPITRNTFDGSDSGMWLGEKLKLNL